MVVGVQLAVVFMADFANGFLRAVRFAALMLTNIVAVGTDAALPLVRLVFDRIYLTAAPLLFVRGCRRCPCGSSGVVVGVQFAVALAADGANRLLDAGRFLERFAIRIMSEGIYFAVVIGIRAILTGMGRITLFRAGRCGDGAGHPVDRRRACFDARLQDIRRQVELARRTNAYRRIADR